MPKALALVQLPRRCWIPCLDDWLETPEALGMTRRIGEDAHHSLDPYKTGVPLDDDSLIPELVAIAKEHFGAVERWQLSEESSETDAPRGTEDEHRTTEDSDTTIRTWWQHSKEDSSVATPRGHEDGAAGHGWSRNRTTSPEDRYVLHSVSGAGTSQYSMFPLPAQQRHTPHADAPVALATAAPPPSQTVLLPRVLWREHARGDQAPSDSACHRQRLVPDGPEGGGPCQAPADAPAHSVGSMGHPHSCALPCKYARGGRACKEGATCSRCHLCPWSRSVEQHARARRSE